MDPPGPRDFATTKWSLVAALRSDAAGESRARAALEQLCQAYWYPLYAFVRFRGYTPEDAQDLTQAFLARMIETGGLGGADRSRGRFRSYILGAMKHFLANEWHRNRAQKRGGRVQFIEWEAALPELRLASRSGRIDSPEEIFDREWAMATIDGALLVLRDEMAALGKLEQFEALKGCLTSGEDLPREQIAKQLGMNVPAVKTAVHRLRARYRSLLRDSIAETVENEDELEDEMRHLLAVLRKM